MSKQEILKICKDFQQWKKQRQKKDEKQAA
jgi:hypothetical protein